MQRDPIRQKIRALLRDNGLSLREAARALGRNPSYLHQFLERGSPQVLSAHDSHRLAELLGCEADELRHPSAPRRKPYRRKLPVAPVTAVLEIEVEAAAGPGALNDESAVQRACWYLPEAMIRHEGGAVPENLRILRARGDSMEPVIHDGDRLVVDIGRITPSTGEMVVLWDGSGLVVKRVEAVLRTEPPKIRLISANPEYKPYTCLAQDAHIVGKVLWTVGRV